MAEGPLHRVRVLDAGNMIAGPMAAGLLADYGADVVKLEHPEFGDPIRDWEPRAGEVPLWWKVLNRNKSAVTLNLGKSEGRELFLRLVAESDVVVENFRSGTFERWRLSYDDLTRVNPGIILLRITGFGQTGPMSTTPGYGTIAEAMSGIPHFTGAADGPPMLPGFPMADSVTAVFGALAVVSALYERDNGDGRGQEIDLALYESLFRIVDAQTVGYAHLGRVKQRQGSRLAEDAPRNVYRTLDGRWIAVSASSNRTWHRLVVAMGKPHLIGDERFESSSRRIENVDELDEIIEQWFAARTEAEAMATLTSNDVVAGPVLDIARIFEHPQYRARENIVHVQDDELGEVVMQGIVPRFSKTPSRIRHAGRRRAADNEAVYGQRLGMTESELDALRHGGVI